MAGEIIPPGEVRGYHLFLMPASPVADATRACIRMLAEKYGGPIFEPHITVFIPTEQSESQLHLLTEKAAAHPAPTLSFDGVRTGEAYFKCCYLAVHTNTGLTAIAQHLRHEAGSQILFDPHISLAYGQFSPKTLAAMKADAEAFFSRHPLPSLPAASLDLWKTHGKADAWFRLASLSLG